MSNFNTIGHELTRTMQSMQHSIDTIQWGINEGQIDSVLVNAALFTLKTQIKFMEKEIETLQKEIKNER